MPRYKDAYLAEDVVSSWRAVFFQDSPQDAVLVIPAVRGVTSIKRGRIPDLKAPDGTREVFSFSVHMADVPAPFVFKYDGMEEAINARNYLIVRIEAYYDSRSQVA